MTAFAIGIITGWLTALAAVAWVDCWPTPGEVDGPRPALNQAGPA